MRGSYEELDLRVRLRGVMYSQTHGVLGEAKEKFKFDITFDTLQELEHYLAYNRAYFVSVKSVAVKKI
jgi:hypothetical protein